MVFVRILDFSMTLLPISAVCCVSKDVLLIAQGSHLLLSRPNSISTLALLSPGTIIHGIRPCPEPREHLHIIFGQKEFQLVQLGSQFKSVYPQPIGLQDWIISCHSFADFIFILTIHNDCSKIRISDGTILQTVAAPIRCILYSATLHGHNFDTLKVASGTVTNRIIVWRPYQPEPEPIFLTGHDGVIFCVEFNTTGTKLVSVSDDRTVRVWQLAGHTQLIVTLYGHTARVWAAGFVPSHNDTFVLSVGEDTTLKLWSVERCENVHTFMGHRGKSVWSVTTSPDGCYAYTGGNDCSVRKWNLTPFVQNSEKGNSRNIELANETPRIVCILNSCVSVVLTSAGSLWEIQTQTGATNLAYKNAIFASYAVMEITHSKDTIAIGGLKGHLLLLSVSDWNVIYLDEICEGKILSLNWCQNQFLLISGMCGFCLMAQLTADKQLIKLHVFTLPYSCHRWVTACLLISEQLILGDGKGSLHLYSNFSDKNPIYSLFKIHGSNPVTSLQQNGEFVYSTGRDGKLKLTLIKDGNLILKNSIQVLRNSSWLERVYVRSGRPIVALAFHGNEILLVNVCSDAVLVRIACGGGHRSWDSNSFEDILDTGKFHLSYTKCQETIMVTREIESDFENPFSVPFLGREGLCLNILDTFEDGAFMLACGDEIGTLSILSSAGESGLRVVSTNQCHIGNINAIEVCCVNKSLFMFTAGGRGLLKVWEINKCCLQNGIFEFYFFVCEVSAKPIYRKKSKKIIGQFEIDDFRITTVSLLSLPPSRCVAFCGCSDGFIRVYLFTPDTLLTHLSCVEHTNRCLLSSCLLYTHNLTPILLTAATDGEVVFWDISKIFQNLDTSLISDSIPDLLSKIKTVTCHLSGVNSICISYNSVLKIATLVSVGDDTSICVTKLSVEPELIEVLTQTTNSGKHFSSIVKVELFEIGERIFVVTSSRDQRLKLFALNNVELTLELKETHLLDVTNVSDMKSQRRGDRLQVFVVGEGLQTFEINL